MKPIRAVLPALLLIAACSSSPEGHIIGQKETLRDPATGEQFEQLTDLQGRRVGVRYTDLRSRGTNPGTGSVTVIVNPPERQ